MQNLCYSIAFLMMLASFTFVSCTLLKKQDSSLVDLSEVAVKSKRDIDVDVTIKTSPK